MNSTANTMRTWRLHEYGQPVDVLKLETVAIPEPGDGELRVRILGVPLNLNDLERVTGGNMMVRPEFPYAPGMEVMGVVDKCGAGCEAWQGKRVIAMTAGAHGGYDEYAICPPVSAFEIPESIALPDAAAIYFAYHLAWLGLYERAKVQAGETVLIHAAAGSVGSAAIQLAVNAGARVIATAGSDEKLDWCRTLGAEIAINYSSDDFVAAVKEATNGKGVDIVFDNVGEAVMEKSLGAVAYNGRYVMNGFSSDKTVADEKHLVPRRLALSNINLCTVLLAYADDAMAEFLKDGMGWNFVPAALGEQITAEITEAVEKGAIKPAIGKVIGFNDIPNALQDLGNRKTIGKIVALCES